MVLNTCKMAAMDDGGGTGTKLDAGDVRRDRVGPDGHANWLDASSGHMDVPDIHNGMNMTADMTETISTCQNAPQMQNLPVEAQKCAKAKPRSCTGMLNMWVDTHGVAIHANTARNMQRHVSTWSTDPKPQDLPTGCTKPYQDGTDGLKSCLDMQMARVHVQDVAKKSNEPENTLITADLPANGAELCIGVPNRLKSQTDTLDACTCMQSNADGSRRPTDNSERIRKSQNGCKKLNSPAKPLKTRPEEPRKPRNRADACMSRAVKSTRK